MSQAKIISFAARKAEVVEQAAFLHLLDADMSSNPEQVVPISTSLFRRMDAIRARAEDNRRTELLEG
jgi:antitoxin PrlF